MKPHTSLPARKHAAPPNRTRGMRRQRGMAVIGALLVVAAAAVAATSIVQQQATLARTLATESDRAQASWLLRGGLDWARIMLRWDARRNATTRADGIWAQPILNLRVNTSGDPREALFSGRIEDEQGKYNLANMADNAVVLPEQELVLSRLLQMLDIPQAMAVEIAWRVAQGQHSAMDPAQAPALRSLEDLRSLDGMRPEWIDRLRPYLTVLPAKTSINANTASAEVLSAGIPGLDLPGARALTGARDRGQWFNNRADVFNRLGNPDIAPGEHIDTASAWFLVSGEVSLDNAIVGMQALVQRKNRETPVIHWIKELH